MKESIRAVKESIFESIKHSPTNKIAHMITPILEESGVLSGNTIKENAERI